MMKKLKTTFFFAVFTFVALSVSAQEKYILRANPDVTKKITQNLVSLIELDFNGKKVVTDFTIKFDMTNTAKKDSLFLCDVICTEIKLSVNTNGTNMSYDSKKPMSNETSKQMHTIFGKLINKSINFSLNQLGSVSNITLPEEIDFPFEKSIYIATELPEHEISIGDSWIAKGIEEQSGAVTESKMTLLEVNDQGYKINVEGKKFFKESGQIGYTHGFCVLDKKTCLTKIIDLTSEVTVLDSKMKTVIKYF